MSEDEIIDDLIRREGGTFTDHPNDRGGATRWGITLQTLREERGPWVLPADVAALTEPEAREIYRRRYIRRPGFDMVKDDRLRALLVDFGVNSGPKRAVIALQQAIGASPDGRFGAETVKRLEGPSGSDSIQREVWGEKVYAGVLASRLRLYVDIVLRDRSQLVFLRGWMNRLGEFF